MISQQAIFLEIEQQLARAKQATTEAQAREALAAIQALCNVTLQATRSTAQPLTTMATTQPLTAMAQPQSLTATKFVEDDGANGDSLFDF